MTRYLHGRYIFDSRMTYSFLYEKWIRGSAIKRTLITEKFTFEDFRVMYGRFSIPLFLVDTENKLQVFTIDDPPKPMPGHTIIHLVDNSALENSHPQH